ncbi:MAG: hypothetical protein V2A74_02035 [bacterium]
MTFRRLHYSIPLLCCVVFSLLALKSAVCAEVSADSQTVFHAGWGDGSGEVGLILQQEQERCGPLSFAVDGTTVYLLDSVHAAVLAAERGTSPTVMAKNVSGWAICGDRAGGVFVQEGEEVRHIGPHGMSMQTLKMPVAAKSRDKIIEGYGAELGADAEGWLIYRGVTQASKRLVRLEGRSVSAADPNASSVLTYQIKRMSGNKVRLLGLDADGKVLVSVPIVLDEGQIGAALFKGLDVEGRLYVELEALTQSGVGLEVHRYASDGKRLGVVRLPNDYFTTVYKKTEVAPDGSVYQMRTTAMGVEIRRWTF